jgi:hypothetical protein
VRRKTAVSCSQLLDQARLPLLERARKLSRFEQAVLPLLPADLAAHCKVLNLKSEILVLATPSPAWAGRLRFAVPELIKQLKRELGLDVRKVELKIQPQRTEPRTATKPPLRISMASATLLAQTARGIDHPPLQEALLRLAAKTGTN